jgi:hypothetical protein
MSGFVRRMLLLILVLGLVGTGTELLLLEHFEDVWQTIPLALIAAGLLTLAAHGVSRRASTVMAIQVVMALCAASGAFGVVLHYRGNAEFEREMSPSIGGVELFAKSMMGATPALAPGTMTLLGLLGLVYTYRHPRLQPDGTDYGA